MTVEDNPEETAGESTGTGVTFESLHLSDALLQATKEMGFGEATAIQAEVIPLARQGSDLVGQAQTGTGKTAAFAIPILEALDPHEKAPQALILVPTRELALQVTEETNNLAKHTGFQTLAIYGGQEIEKQIKELEQHAPRIIVGTPGRVLDHLSRYTLDLSKIRAVVLDEADRMLDMGFIDDVQFILEKCPKSRQTMLFSATMPGPILEMAKKHLQTPEFIRVSADKLTVEGIEQFFVSVDPREKMDALASLLEQKRQSALAIVFSSTKQWADTMAHKLQEAGFKAMPLHGNLTQAMRDRVMADFRAGQVEVLVATDLASRGLDIDDVGIVVNYDLPMEYEYYIHRIGRTGRMGRAGLAVTLVTNVHEIKQLRKIAAMAQSDVQPMHLQLTRRVPRTLHGPGGPGGYGGGGGFQRGPPRGPRSGGFGGPRRESRGGPRSGPRGGGFGGPRGGRGRRGGGRGPRGGGFRHRYGFSTEVTLGSK